MTDKTLGLVIEPDVLAERLGDKNLLIVDLCRDDIYRAQHIPGAVHVSPAELVSGQPPAIGRLPELSRLESLFARIGYSPDQHIVAYDDEGGGWAGRFIWTLDVIGHSGASYLNGGLIAWAGEGYPMTDEVPDVPPTTADLAIHKKAIAEKADVMESIDNDQIKVWDARSPEEYTGQKVAAARGGHVPGAINLDWLELMDRNANLRLRKDLARLVDEAGFHKGDRVITHCQTHHRSGLTYLAGKLLGFDIRAYHGSWSEWGNDPDTPIDNPSGH